MTSRLLPLPIVPEAHPDFDKLANQQVKQSVEMARDSAGVVDVGQDWERTATPEQREARRQESLRKEKKVEETLDTSLSGEIRAKYKIEITFGPQRTVQGPNIVGIQIWESGKRFHGGGDELAFWCKDNREGHEEGCWGVILSDYIHGGVALCPYCKRMVNVELLTTMRIGRVTSQNLAKELVLIFRNLNSNADLYAKYHKTDPRYMALAKTKGDKVAHRLKGLSIYPLRNIIKDTANGAELAKRFFAFVTA